MAEVSAAGERCRSSGLTVCLAWESVRLGNVPFRTGGCLLRLLGCESERIIDGRFTGSADVHPISVVQ